MNNISIKNVTLGSGKPKICIPIVGQTLYDISLQVQKIIDKPVDIIEWRADFYKNLPDFDEAASIIHSIIGETPLLFTIRTANEGGELAIHFDEYAKLLKSAAANPYIDAVDVEYSIADKSLVSELISEIKKNAVVIASNHDFHKTPDASEIVSRLKTMEDLGADVCKIAVMPQSTSDVLTLLTATSEAHNTVNQPIITMSMGSLGLISRLSGEVFGSALTFGCVDMASAPGQINARELATVLNIIDKNI